MWKICVHDTTINAEPWSLHGIQWKEASNVAIEYRVRLLLAEEGEKTTVRGKLLRAICVRGPLLLTSYAILIAKKKKNQRSREI